MSSPFDRSSMTRWRQRMGEDEARRAVAGEPCDRDPDGSSQARPTSPRRSSTRPCRRRRSPSRPDAKLMHRARERLVRLAAKHGVDTAPILCARRQARALKQQRYAHAKQFKPGEAMH